MKRKKTGRRLANVRTLRNTLVHSGAAPSVPRRILLAWTLGAQDELIAAARVVENRLLVVSCAMDRLELSFEEVPALKRLPEKEREHFEIAEDGSYVRWPGADVDLDLDALRYHTNAAHRRRTDRERLARDERFGSAVAAVRGRHSLRQTDIKGLSARQVRRIEKGQGASLSSLEKLAWAHRMETGDYLEEVAEEMENV